MVYCGCSPAKGSPKKPSASTGAEALTLWLDRVAATVLIVRVIAAGYGLVKDRASYPSTSLVERNEGPGQFVSSGLLGVGY